MNHKIDTNDVEYIEKRYGKVLGWVPGAIKRGKINPQVTQAYLGENVFASVFHVKPVYYETYTGTWRPLSEVTVHHGNHSIVLNGDWWKIHPRYLNWLDKRCRVLGGELLIPSLLKTYPTPYAGLVRELHQSLIPPKIGLTTSTFYPDPNAESTTVDGPVVNDRSTTSWDTTHDATSASNDLGLGGAFPSRGEPANWTEGIFSYQYQGGSRTIISRGFFLFDTASIDDTDTISSATFSWYVLYELDYSDNTSQEYIALVSSTPASNTDLVVGDFDQCGDAINNPTKGASDLTNASVSLNAYNDWALNATGLGWITKTGVTKLGLREGHDVEDVVPTYSGDTNDVYSVAGRFADYTGTSSDPKLVVVHASVGASFIPRISFIM